MGPCGESPRQPRAFLRHACLPKLRTTLGTEAEGPLCALQTPQCFASVLPLVKVQEETDGADGVVACREGGPVATREVGGVPTSPAVRGRSGSVSYFPLHQVGTRCQFCCSKPSVLAAGHRAVTHGPRRWPEPGGPGCRGLGGREERARAGPGPGCSRASSVPPACLALIVQQTVPRSPQLAPCAELISER